MNYLTHLRSLVSPKITLTAVFCILGIQSFTPSFAFTDPVNSHDLTGTWQGTWKRESVDARVIVVFSKSTIYRGYWDAKLYFVDEPGLEIPLQQTYVKSTTLHFALPGNEGDYTGEIAADGDFISGKLTQNSHTHALEIARIALGAKAWQRRLPTFNDLNRYLAISYYQNSLTSDSAFPFHLLAHVEILQSSAISVKDFVTIDETWLDTTHWRLIITHGDSKFQEITNGDQSYTTGSINPKQACCAMPEKPGLVAIVNRAEAALFSLYRPLPTETRKLSLVDSTPCKTHTDVQPKGGHNFGACACLEAEPRLKAIDSSTPVAATTYCFTPHDFALHSVRLPDGFNHDEVELFDLSPFGTKQIARTIDVIQMNELVARVHVTTLETATDSSFLHLPPPPEAHNELTDTQQALLSNQVFRGQIIHGATSEVTALLKKAPGCVCTLTLNLFVDTTGSVYSSSPVRDTNSLMSPAIAEAVRKWKFRVSYRGDHAIATNIPVTIWSGTP